jgi:hypothetical protein
MEWSMQQSKEPRDQPGTGKALAIAAALLFATELSQPNLAYAGPHGGGGGFGGFHGGGGFHSGGFAGSHDGGFHGERFRDGRFDHDRFRDRRFFFGGSFAYPWWGYYPDYGYYDYGYSQPYSSQIWNYCSDPVGYYPYVTQCNTSWQAVPAG